MSPDKTHRQVLAVIENETTHDFWKTLARRFDWAYSESFHAVEADTRTLPKQKPAKLLDERFYLAERALHDAARARGAISSEQVVPINGWNYTFVRMGGVCVLQSYVRDRRGVARAAKLRDKHAAINSFLREPELPLADVPAELFIPLSVAGIVVHGPAGTRFNEQEQRLGALRFAVPHPDGGPWPFSISVEALIAHLQPQQDAEAAPQRDIAKPKRKTRRKYGSGDQEA